MFFFQLILVESSTRFKTSSLVHGTSERSAASLESPRRATAPREVPDLRIDGLEPQKPRRGQSAQANIIGLSGCLGFLWGEKAPKKKKIPRCWVLFLLIERTKSIVFFGGGLKERDTTKQETINGEWNASYENLVLSPNMQRINDLERSFLSVKKSSTFIFLAFYSIQVLVVCRIYSSKPAYNGIQLVFSLAFFSSPSLGRGKKQFIAINISIHFCQRCTLRAFSTRNFK